MYEVVAHKHGQVVAYHPLVGLIYSDALLRYNSQGQPPLSLVNWSHNLQITRLQSKVLMSNMDSFRAISKWMDFVIRSHRKVFICAVKKVSSVFVVYYFFLKCYSFLFKVLLTIRARFIIRYLCLTLGVFEYSASINHEEFYSNHVRSCNNHTSTRHHMTIIT